MSAEVVSDRPEVVALLTPTGRDGPLAERVLRAAGVPAAAHSSMAALCEAVSAGVGAIVVAEEALRRTEWAELAVVLDAQPAWSDVPVILLTAEGGLSRAISPALAEVARRVNVVLLERPVRLATLTTAVRSALRARERQYDIRDHLFHQLAAERTLRESESRLRAMVVAVPYPLMLHANDGSVIELSSAWTELTGYGADDLPTTQAWAHLAFGEAPSALRLLPAAGVEAADPGLGRLVGWGEQDVRTRDGTIRRWDFHTASLGRLPDGRHLHLTAAVDVTDYRRLIESEQSARRQAEIANRAKTDFLTVMSHELRTPLNAIAGYAELLEMGIHGPVTDAQREALGRIKRSEGHLLGLINDVLNFAKLEAGRVTIDVEPVPVNDLIRAVETLVAPQMGERQLRYVGHPTDDSVWVMADEDKARQVLLNLLTNAAKFTPPGGSVTLDAVVGASQVTFRVADTGVGIEASELDAVFEPFVQVRRGLTSSHEGTGLGLAISRDLARAMDGALQVESEPGRGSIFTLSLPRAAAPS